MLAIIPARGGSKQVPQKNIKSLCGKPLIAYTIEAAQAAKSVDRVIVSTDDPQIEEAAKKSGAEIPFMRPKELAQDDSKAIDTYLYTVEKLNVEFNGNYKEFVVLLPTSPLRVPEDIDNAVSLFHEKKADSVISCVEVSFPPVWMKKIDRDGKITNYFNVATENKNRQEFETAFKPNGSIYVFKYAFLKEKYSYYSNNTYAYLMPQERSVDIDSQSDFNYAEYLMRAK